MPRRATPDSSLADKTLRPHNLEPKTEFIARWCEDKSVRKRYPTLIARHAAGERMWNARKAQSLVSITTSQDQFLLF